MFDSMAEATALAEDPRNGPSVRAWTALAARRRLHLVAGLDERPGGQIGVFICYDNWFSEVYRVRAAGHRLGLCADQLDANAGPAGEPGGDGEHAGNGRWRAAFASL